MPDIHIHREHDLGLAKARQLALQWVADAEKRFQMACTTVEGETSDTVAFARSGVKGALIVAADHFQVDAKLGFLLGAFSAKIEAEIGKNLDALLSEGTQPAGKAPGAASKPGRK